MRRISTIINDKIVSVREVVELRNQWKAEGLVVVFTNGVFDILHAGHIQSLAGAASFGDKLIVGLNADSSVRRLKGASRPIINEKERAILLAALFFVDAIVLFEGDTPLELITALLPDVLVKSADYTVAQIAGAKEVIANGGKVELIPMVQGLSTSNIVEKIRQANS